MFIKAFNWKVNYKNGYDNFIMGKIYIIYVAAKSHSGGSAEVEIYKFYKNLVKPQKLLLSKPLGIKKMYCFAW